MRPRLAILLIFVLSGLLIVQKAAIARDGATITVAVAANAARPAKEIARAFEDESTASVRIVTGSSGKLYHQILQGAPFVVFLSADDEYTALLEEKGLTSKTGRFPYAIGRLVIWSPAESLGDEGLDIEERGPKALEDKAVKRIAAANPKTAPYGRAAIETLEAYGLFYELEPKLIYGESVGQAFAFARSGNAEAAMVALSSIYGEEGESYVIDDSKHSPIVQEAAIINNPDDEVTSAALEFMEFLRSEASRAILDKYGYLSPEAFAGR